MHRAWRAVVAAVAVAALVGGCATSVGVDGDLTDDWAAFSAPGPFAPAAGVCHEGDFTETVALPAYAPVDCALSHRVETVHVGAFQAGRPAPPPGGSTELRGAFADCDTRATGYVGDDWRAGRLRLSVAIPSKVGWAAGSRWYRCDLSEVNTVEAGATAVARTGSLRDALRSVSALRLGCQQSRGGGTAGSLTLAPVACGTRHDAEFVGVWRAPDRPYPTRDADWAPLYDGCRIAIGRYVGVPNDPALRLRSAVVVRPPGAGRWRVGDRGVRCYLRLSDRTVTGSLKGAGPAGFPIRTK